MKPLLFVLALTLSLRAEEKWTRIESPHFELFTDGPKARALSTLEHFERIRKFFVQSFQSPDPPVKPRVVLFANEKAYRAFRARENTAAYFIGLPHRGMIVIGPGVKAEDERIITHEYIHMLVNQAELRLPLWLDEGLAELYSTLKQDAKGVIAGTPISQHVARLRRDWPDVKQVLNAADYGLKEHTGSFYAVSWAICHMLVLEDDLRPKFPRFIKAIDDGYNSEQALKMAYGLTPLQLEQHVQGYLRVPTVNVVRFPVQFEALDAKLEPAPASPLQTGLLMADLYLSAKDFNAASTRAAKLAADYPNQPEPLEALAVAQIGAGNLKEAAAAARSAWQRKSNNKGVLLIAALTTDPAERRQLLERVVQLDPDDTEARLGLAELESKAGNYAAAWTAISGVRRLAPKDRATFYPAFVRAAWESGRHDVAKVAAQRYLAQSTDAKDRALAEQWVRYIENNGSLLEAKPVEIPNDLKTVTGELLRVDCGEGPPVLFVITAERSWELQVDPTSTLEVGATKDGTNTKLACGPLKKSRRVTIGYRPNAPRQSPDGFARKVLFLP